MRAEVTVPALHMGGCHIIETPSRVGEVLPACQQHRSVLRDADFHREHVTNSAHAQAWDPGVMDSEATTVWPRL